MTSTNVDDIEIQLLLDAIYQRYGYDFHLYSPASLRRRIMHRLSSTEFNNISDMIPVMLHDQDFFHHFLQDMSITFTEMFRDPSVYRYIREEVIPYLRTYPYIKIWHAGCATGEEVYSMAILLHEAGLLEKCQIYATDFNDYALSEAKEGIYDVKNFKEYKNNYIESGGQKNFEDYYDSKYNVVKIKNFLSKPVTFSSHNLVCDTVFGEMHLIVCRNVMIYFRSELQKRVLQLFLDSLSQRGFLCLGTKESIRDQCIASQLVAMSNEHRLYRAK